MYPSFSSSSRVSFVSRNTVGEGGGGTDSLPFKSLPTKTTTTTTIEEEGGNELHEKKIKRKGHGETEYADSRHRLFPDIGIDG